MLDSPPTPTQPVHRRALKLEPVPCAVCGASGAPIVGSGEDFEYRTSDDEFRARRCDTCGLVYLDPRPAASELDRIYGPDYHAFAFTAEAYGLVHRVRRRLEARRLLCACEGLPANARILDVGCGDGFHLKLLKDHGRKSWTLEGADTDERAVTAARAAGLRVHCGKVEQLELPANSYHLVLMVMTVEHLADPVSVMQAVRRLLVPGGRVVIVTDNVGSPDFALFGGRHWGGYHFPRHWNLFNASTLAKLASVSGFTAERIATSFSPVNWVYSIRNWLDDWGAPRWLVNRFSLKSAAALGVCTLLDVPLAMLGCGAILQATFRKPGGDA